jgi:hypothetical protein
LARKAGGDVVVQDGGDAAVRTAPRRGPRAGAQAQRRPQRGLAATGAELVVLAEDDVEAPAWWPQAPR